jgi:hypothetical protein
MTTDSRDAVAPTIAGHSFTRGGLAGGMLSLRIALGGGDLVGLARRLAKLEGVRVTGGPGGDRERCFLVSCSGFKMVLSCPADEPEDSAAALVSRVPPAALTIVSDLGSLLDRLMTEPSRLIGRSSAGPREVSDRDGDPSSQSSFSQTKAPAALRRSGLKQGKPLVRKTPLLRKSPLARGSFRKPWETS